VSRRPSVHTHHLACAGPERVAQWGPEKLLFCRAVRHVTIDIGVPRQPLTLPQTAITYNTYGNIVFVVQTSKDDKGKDQPLFRSSASSHRAKRAATQIYHPQRDHGA